MRNIIDEIFDLIGDKTEFSYDDSYEFTIASDNFDTIYFSNNIEDLIPISGLKIHSELGVVGFYVYDNTYNVGIRTSYHPYEVYDSNSPTFDDWETIQKEIFEIS